MKEKLKKLIPEWRSIPNLMSLFRFLLIPLFIWLFIGCNNKELSVGVILLSAATDIFDGVIARRFNMITDLGKILDPLADKFTILALMLCMMPEYKGFGLLIIFLFIKEITVAFWGGKAMKQTGIIHSSKWYGKLCTVITYTCIICLILFDEMPAEMAAGDNGALCTCYAVCYNNVWA